jgi:hypothetical protein
MSRWFRLYDEMLDDPKVQKLHPALFKVLVNIWCVASRNDGRLPSHADIAFALRMSEDETFRAVSKLADFGFIDTDAATGEQRPHAWDQRQFRSDVSTDRVRAHRNKLKGRGKTPPNGGGEKVRDSHLNDQRNDHETFHGTAPETDTETDNSVAKATGTVVPHPAADFCKAIFDSGVTLLAGTGMAERHARSLLGRLRQKLNDDPAMLVILRQAETEQPSEPAAWLTAAVETRNGNRSNRRLDGQSDLRGARPDPSVDLYRAACAAEQEAGSTSDWSDHSGAWLSLPSSGAG